MRPRGRGEMRSCFKYRKGGGRWWTGGRYKNLEFYVTYWEEDTLLNPTNSSTHLQQDVPWTHFSNFTLPWA